MRRSLLLGDVQIIVTEGALTGDAAPQALA